MLSRVVLVRQMGQQPVSVHIKGICPVEISIFGHFKLIFDRVAHSIEKNVLKILRKQQRSQIGRAKRVNLPHCLDFTLQKWKSGI